ncbi:MAG: hypothetical protein GXO90_10975 [FCB group bacterium]|nr:hypothetical protein [FCB group bacterium]
MAGWKTVLREMTAIWPVIYLETREKNSAETTANSSFGTQAIASDLVKAAHGLNLIPETTLWFGSSLGATAILEAIHSLDIPPLALALVGPNAEFRIPLWGRVLIACFPPALYSLMKPFVKWYLRTFRLDVAHDHKQYEKYCTALDEANPARLKRGAQELARYTVWDRLPEIECPVLIFGGSRDILHEPENLRLMERLLPKGRYLDMGTNSATHSPAMVQHLEKFVNRVMEKPGKMTGHRQYG